MGDEEENPGPTSGRPELKSAAEVFDKWEKLFPGRARLIHGQMTAADKESALADMRSGAAAVLIATTVIEVGMNLPLLRRVVVIHPERFGVSTLHQIRGRVARHGGVGYCDLFLPNPVKETTMERLRILERTQDGFTVAEHDMRLRGVGDLSRISSRQSGADLTFFFGRPVSVEALDAVMIKMDEMGEPTCRP
jgi:ATP-dependent DNA helicase RecG